MARILLKTLQLGKLIFKININKQESSKSRPLKPFDNYNLVYNYDINLTAFYLIANYQDRASDEYSEQ